MRFKGIPMEGDEDGIMVGETDPLQDGVSTGASLNPDSENYNGDDIRERTYVHTTSDTVHDWRTKQ